VNVKSANQTESSEITIFLCGDVMTGRGIDQALPNQVHPRIYESYVKDARGYLHLAEEENGPIDQPVSFSYIWGDALQVWRDINPVAKIINLETSITAHNEPWPGKGINYRMHPRNIPVFTEAGIDFCSVANNHILDWSYGGLRETLQTLEDAKIAYAGAGNDIYEARKPATLSLKKGRIIIFSYGSPTSGVPKSWSATPYAAGVNVISELSKQPLNTAKEKIRELKQPGDIVIFSIHWGSNWGYDITARQQAFAHRLIDEANVDVIHGHSSHHPRGIEVYKNKLIIYGAGDFINDYEGISGHDKYRDDLTLMYFPKIDISSGDLISMKMIPMQIKNLHLNHVSDSDASWLFDMLNREGDKLGTSITLNEDNSLSLRWP